MSDNPIRPVAVSVKTAKTMLEVGHTKFWELLAENEIASFHIGRKRMVLVASIEEFVVRQLALAEASPR